MGDEARVTSLLAAMTLEEKIGQITQVDRSAISPDEVADLAIGSVLSGGGGNPDPNTPATWRAMVTGYVEASRRSRLGIPILYGTDAVHGHNNVVGATIFPHNIGLGAADDAALVERIGRATALETAATGARWTFAPTVAVPQDPRWGRTYEGYGQDPGRVAALGAALVAGLQGDGLQGAGLEGAGLEGAGLQGAGDAIDVLACAKHFIADGATVWGSTSGAEWVPWWVASYGEPGWHIDQGDAPIDEATLRAVHLPPYRDAVERGVGSVMASYSSVNGDKVHAHRGLLTDLLKGELGFDGFVVSDYMAIDQVDRDYRTAVVRCLDAGIDLVMVPFDHLRFRETVRAAVEDGDLAVERLDDAVRRILRVKQAMGLLDEPHPALPDLSVVGSREHRALAREAAAAGCVRLVDDGVLPLASDTTVLIAGAAADDVGLACGGWTIEWGGAAGDVTPGSTLLDGLREHLGDRLVTFDPAVPAPVTGDGALAETPDGARAETPDGALGETPDGALGETPDGALAEMPDGALAGVAIVVVNEPPYAEGRGDTPTLALDDAQVALVHTVATRAEQVVLVVVSGRPLLLDAVLDDVDAVVAAWLPGSEAAGVADVLVGDRPFRGRLPLDWPAEDPPAAPGAVAPPPRWPRGHGLVTAG